MAAGDGTPPIAEGLIYDDAVRLPTQATETRGQAGRRLGLGHQPWSARADTLTYRPEQTRSALATGDAQERVMVLVRRAGLA
ncbi:hypothetical protein ABZ825_40100, partial [Streptomyces tauricus]|uniref:hypothetical protein n=1 Tax=Streptomyces tauricus TaxID=68274 RepID=UPI0033EB145B